MSELFSEEGEKLIEQLNEILSENTDAKTKKSIRSGDMGCFITHDGKAASYTRVNNQDTKSVYRFTPQSMRDDLN